MPSNEERARKAAKKIQAQVAQFTGPRMIRIMNEAIRTLRDLIKTRHMGGSATGPKRLARNTGKMEKNTIATRASNKNGNVTAAIKINVPHASVHFGEGNKTQTVIKPRIKQALTVPLPGILGGDKRPRFAARSKQISGKYITDHGVLYGRLPGGKSQMPLFVLRTSVVVPVRVSVERDIKPEGERILKETIEREATKIFGAQ